MEDIELLPLLKSNVFQFEFKFNEWPAVHSSDETQLMPYSESIFDLRNSYGFIFSEDEEFNNKNLTNIISKNKS
jgi:hypothetical protein